jgi:hypothetical protein
MTRQIFIDAWFGVFLIMLGIIALYAAYRATKADKIITLIVGVGTQKKGDPWFTHYIFLEFLVGIILIIGGLLGIAKAFLNI